ncbi:MAG: hypothetical protein QGG19_23300 [Alphaproteobacteria bacterium]|nr:hypothetical protein [Alphaproteobacteria bacterium]MDP6257264.1 hypothetical protein [Alphaproteobacteria bacterium]MDP7231056.1 hypothetical protein [Alphaproteobacteria bacterium]MDP7461056.1 hypothetical protein [Alphaproteobacteria bacterium]MEE1555575.1 hypothetical protein [Alphaproteobacteria bacterium]
MFLFDPFRMIADIGRANRNIYFWGGALNIPQVVGGVFFFDHVEAQSILVVAIIGLIVAGQIHKKAAFSRLIGMCHLLWLLLLPWLIYRLAIFEHAFWFEAWLYYTSITIAVSLIFDAMDLYRYSKGQKTFAWSEDKSG